MTSSETARGAKGSYKEKQSQKKINHELPARHGKVDFGVDETPSFRADTHPEHYTTIEGGEKGLVVELQCTWYLVRVPTVRC